MNNKIKTILKIVFSILLMTLVIKLSDPEKIAKTISNANVFMLIIAFILILLGTFIASYRWFTVMNTLNYKGDVKFYIKSYFLGVFFSQLLPSSIGGDAYRVIDVSSLGYKKRDAFLGVLIDRGLGIVGIFIVNIVFNNILTTLLPKAIHNILNIISITGIIGFILFALINRIDFFKTNKVTIYLVKASEYLANVLNTPKKALFQMSLSVLIHLITFVGVYFIALAVGANLSIATFMVIMPPVILLTIIPISLAGWGIREGAMVGLFSFVGVEKDVAVSISIIFGLCYVIQGLIGLILWIQHKHKG